MNLNEFLDEILLEVSVRVKEGYPNFKNPIHIRMLSEILSEYGLNEIKYELIENLIEAEEDYKHIGAGIYIAAKDAETDGDGTVRAKNDDVKKYRKDGEGEGASFTAISDDEVEKIKQAQGDAGEKAAANTAQNQPKDDSDKSDVGNDGSQPEEEKPDAEKDPNFWDYLEKDKDDKGKKIKKTIKPYSQESIDSIDSESKKGGLEGTVSAPGTPSSTVNEIGTGMAMACLEGENPDECLSEKLGSTKIGKRYNKPKYRGQMIQSAKAERRRISSHLYQKGMNPKTTSVSHVWGSEESLNNSVQRLEDLKNKGVDQVNGIPIDDYKQIILEGGAGDNPTDTVIFLIDNGKKPPKVEILHTSNKMSSADIQSNGTPIGEINSISKLAIKELESEEDIKKVNDAEQETKQKISQARIDQKIYISSQAKKMNNHVQDDKTVDRILARLEGDETTEPKGISTSKGKYFKEVLKQKNVKSFLKQKGYTKPLTQEQKREIFRLYTSIISSDGVELRDNDVQILSRLYMNEKYSTGRETVDEPIFKESKMKSFYEIQTDAVNEHRTKLNDIKSGLGDKTFTRRMIKRLHLDIAEGKNPGGIPNDNFALNMGEYPKKDIKKDSNGDLYQKVGKVWYKVNGDGSLDTKPSEYSDKDLNNFDCAVIADAETHRHCLGLDEGEDIESGFNISYDDIQKEGESFKAMIYDRNGNVVAYQTCRSKSGPGGSVNDTIQWSTDYQQCMAKFTFNEGKCG